MKELALSISGKKNKIKIDNFINLAKNYNLLDVQIERIFKNYIDKKHLIIDTINDSLLSEELKIKYINIVLNRYNRLFD